MEKVKMKELERLNLGANVCVLGYDTVAKKTGLIAVSEVRENIPWFGRKWRKGDSSSVGSAVGDLDFGTVLPYLLELGGYLVQNDHTRVKLSDVNHRFLKNGAAADLTGGAGHYQWGWNVPMYYQNYEDNTYFYETISLGGPRKGFWNYYIPVGSRSCAGYATMDRINNKLVSFVNYQEQYRGGNNDSSLDATHKSQLCKPATNLSISTFRAAARQNGTLWFANERVMQFTTAMLKRIIFGNRNIQAAINSTRDANGLMQGGTGMGADLPTNWSENFGNYPYLTLDVGIDDGDYTGVFSVTIDEDGNNKVIGNIPSFFGLKNDYKHLYCMCENMLLECNADKSQSLFIDDKVDGSLMSLDRVTGLTKIATGPASDAAGWIYPKDYVLKDLAFFPGQQTGGSSSTFYCDGYYNPAVTSGLRGALLLGVAYNGDLAGSLSLDGSAAPSAAAAYCAAFLCEYAEAFSTKPFWCAMT